MLTILQGDVIEQLRTLPDESVHCCVTSPPYWGLRDYGTNGQLGLEKTPLEYVAKMVAVFREVRRVLRKDGTLWMNMGDSYNSPNTHTGKADKVDWGLQRVLDAKANAWIGNKNLKPKDLMGIPWRLAFALQADGWWLRSDIIWAKPNPMPESVTDRPTKAHEYIFLLTKSANYFYDAEAIREPHNQNTIDTTGRVIERGGGRQVVGELGAHGEHSVAKVQKGIGDGKPLFAERWLNPSGRNKRTVWTVATAPYPEAHFATYPPDLIKPCILAGTSAKGCCAECWSPWERIVEQICDSSWQRRKNDGHVSGFDTESGAQQKQGSLSDAADRAAGGFGVPSQSKTIGWQPTCKCLEYERLIAQENTTIPCTVLDPFAGSGTTGAVALELGRKAILIELNQKYVELIKTRCNVTPGLQLA